MTVPTAELTAAVSRYAERFHAVAGSTHHVASPLGGWLVLALAAPAAAGENQALLDEVLGVPVDLAAEAADRLLDEPHPVVASAVAAWHQRAAETNALRGWLAGLPDAVERGDVPTQAMADAWARDRTKGMIEAFPIRITPLVVLVLASALATKVSWQRAFEVVPAVALGDSPWATTLQRVLRSPESGHDCYIAQTDRAGRVAVHTARDELGLAVTSVIAATEVATADVLAAAHEAAAGTTARTSLFDLPLGDAPLWTIAEAPSHRGGGRQEDCVAVLPAWSARSDHELAGVAGLGFDEAAGALIALLPKGDWDYDARQSAYARYSREGFEAAAVTTLGVRLAAAFGGDGVKRTATLRFGHPYAVVATVESDESPWDGLPVFSAWVAEPENAEAD
jgi:hypothetical protein